MKPSTRRIVLGLLLGTVTAIGFYAANSSAADDQAATTALPPHLAHVPQDAVFFHTVYIAQIWDHPVVRELREKAPLLAEEISSQVFQAQLGLPAADVDHFTFAVTSAQPVENQLVFVSTRRPFDKRKLLAALTPDAKETKVDDHIVYATNRRAVTFYSDRLYAIGRADVLEQYLKTPVKEGPQSGALKIGAGKHTFVAGINVPLIAQTAGNQVPPQLTAIVPLLKAKSLAVVGDLDKHVSLHAEAKFDSEDDAKAGEKAAREGLALLQEVFPVAIQAASQEKDVPAIVDLLKDAQDTLKAAQPRRTATTVRLDVEFKTDVATLGAPLAAAVQKLHESAGRIESQNNLKQIAIAMHSFHDLNGKCPAAAIYSKDGKPLLSWRVAILPFIEQETLYKEFHLDESWDSPHNVKLVEKMPKIYQHPKDKPGPPYATRYLVFTGKDTAFQGTQGPRLPASFPDGTSNTIMVVEADKAVPWSKPEDLPYDAKKPLPKFCTLFPNGFNVSVWDGSVRFVSNKISDKTMRAAITPAGGEVLGADW